jgi:two-component system, NtrC family, nitrogen regulation sensor histidine kinase NtrY
MTATTTTASGDIAASDDRTAIAGASRSRGLIGAGLIVISLLTAVATFLIMADLTPIEPRPDRIRGLLLVNAGLIAALTGLVAFEAWQIFRARRIRRAGSQLHGRIVSLISFAAAAPAIILAVTATATLDRALAPWFFGPIRSFVEGSTDFARDFVNMQCQTLRRDTRIMSVDVSRVLASTRIRDREVFRSFLRSRVQGLEISFLSIIDEQGRVYESATTGNSSGTAMPTPDDFRRINAAACLPFDSGQPIRVIMPIDTPAGLAQLFLFTARPFDPRTPEVFQNSQAAVAEYQRNEQTRAALQFDFAAMFLLMAAVVLLSAIWVGLRFADWLVAPVGRLIAATDAVATGNYAVAVPVRKSDGDLAHLSETFNKMTGELQAQRTNLVEANDQLDERRRFTEAVLSGVPAGVVGIDRGGVISSLNPMAERLLGGRRDDRQEARRGAARTRAAARRGAARPNAPGAGRDHADRWPPRDQRLGAHHARAGRRRLRRDAR